MSKRNPRLLINDILESIKKIESYIGKEDFEHIRNDPKTIDAVIRNLEIIGEAANKIPREIKKKSPSIKWRQIIGLRNRVIHEYFGVDLKIIWQIIQHDLEEFEHELEDLKERL